MNRDRIGTWNPLRYPRFDVNGQRYNKPATTVGIGDNHFVVALSGILTSGQRAAAEALIGLTHEIKAEGEKDGVHDDQNNPGRAGNVDGKRPNSKRNSEGGRV